MRPARLDARELAGNAFSCLPGCGFCCTFQPEASTRELALLRKRLGNLKVVADAGRSYLALQNKCGACTLLQRKECQAYDLRPAHCRYFPFHVHFADEPEVLVNYTCRGVERIAEGDLAPAFEASVLANVPPDEWARHEAEARATYGEFQRRARRAGAWGDVAAVLERALPGAARLLTGAGILAALARADEPADLDEVHAEAMAPFAAADVTKRPFHLAPDLRWLTFARAGDALDVLEMGETGELHAVQRLADFATWQDAPAAAREGLGAHIAALAMRRAFAGSVYALVDDSDYRMAVEQATWACLAEVGADLAVRARVLAAMGVPDERLADETARFYDSAFLDAPTIGGWL